MQQIEEIISLAWRLYSNKVSSELLNPRNEKMMQLQLAQIFQLLLPLYEAHSEESYKVILEHPVRLGAGMAIIDIVIEHTFKNQTTKTAIELKCFRLYSNNSDTKKRGAQNLGMYDYWSDIENIEKYCLHAEFQTAYQLTLTDDAYYVDTQHTGAQVSVYSTYRNRKNVSGKYEQAVANRNGKIFLQGSYDLPWNTNGKFHFILQKANI